MKSCVRVPGATKNKKYKSHTQNIYIGISSGHIY